MSPKRSRSITFRLLLVIAFLVFTYFAMKLLYYLYYVQPFKTLNLPVRTDTGVTPHVCYLEMQRFLRTSSRAGKSCSKEDLEQIAWRYACSSGECFPDLKKTSRIAYMSHEVRGNRDYAIVYTYSLLPPVLFVALPAAEMESLRAHVEAAYSPYKGDIVFLGTMAGDTVKVDGNTYDIVIPNQRVISQGHEVDITGLCGSYILFISVPIDSAHGESGKRIFHTNELLWKEVIKKS